MGPGNEGGAAHAVLAMIITSSVRVLSSSCHAMDTGTRSHTEARVQMGARLVRTTKLIVSLGRLNA